ncbi:14-3-3-like protein GF14 epsilon [Tritrichomonas foetus]|uniref:14-3-3-like protein GF14 epsilon n=1 Tax=Tritrichomonas foetus TaxID=1144522 RepID=A0A1J4K470_9EUKA|nr:14-3-3-like protein GF14 epsilon [Tritrichomonas foetus]|eukprot:OHT05640.1 14-3-3-like protein GF14 epsilon [Tritrichomonas foetus]
MIQNAPSDDDVFFLANILHEISRPKDGLELLYKFAEKKPSFNSSERSSFGIIFKASVDSIRKSLRILADHYADEEENNHSEYCDRIKEVQAKSFDDLEKLCNETLDAIINFLLPNAENIQSEVFFLKLKGDIYRYISEFATGEEREKSLLNAETAYSSAIPKATDHLIEADPVRLGLLLNYAVFKYEHKRDCEDAKELLRNAIENVGNDFSDLTQEAVDETKSIIEVMQSNLNNWSEYPDEDEDEDEEDHEHESNENE